INGDGFVVNGAPFNGNRIDCKPLVGSNEEWRVSTQTGSHPMHIHINHFQVVEFAGREVKPAIWKDCVWVDPADEEAGNPDRYAIVRMHYHKYWGDFVMHCHVLDHEDQGMMQRVTVVRDPKEADLSRDVPPGGTAAVP
ncbi:MAG: multicopper oxidase domain-containing protein, partial [Bacteroidota bacterium]